jgi:hypothetical protein
MTFASQMEIEGQSRPALIAETISLAYDKRLPIRPGRRWFPASMNRGGRGEAAEVAWDLRSSFPTCSVSSAIKPAWQHVGI